MPCNHRVSGNEGYAVAACWKGGRKGTERGGGEGGGEEEGEEEKLKRVTIYDGEGRMDSLSWVRNVGSYLAVHVLYMWIPAYTIPTRSPLRRGYVLSGETNNSFR